MHRHLSSVTHLGRPAEDSVMAAFFPPSHAYLFMTSPSAGPSVKMVDPCSMSLSLSCLRLPLRAVDLIIIISSRTMRLYVALTASFFTQQSCEAYIALPTHFVRPSAQLAKHMHRAQRLFVSNQDDEDLNQLDLDRDEFIEMLKQNADFRDKFESRKRDYAETDPNLWLSSDIDDNFDAAFESTWDEKLNRQDDNWSAFTNLDTSSSEEDSDASTFDAALPSPEDDGEEAWLNTLQSISADEINFMSREADRADNVRQMQELGFGEESIGATLGVATDDELERDLDNKLFEAFKKETSKSGFGMYVEDDVDLETVESHTRVDWDDELDEPVRSQMVYVDEHTCIGCTNCAMIAQSTFFMEPEHGRARVFRQWGDDDETIQVAIQTCPVDCIHYVPYDELKKLEIQRRDQNINFKARLVNQGEYQASHGNTAKYGGSRQFTEAQTISGNMGSRCNNCPTRGCANCPMYGVGLNPEFKKKEKLRKERLQKAATKKRRESEEKRAEL